MRATLVVVLSLLGCAAARGLQEEVPPPERGEGLKTVEVSAEGYDKDDALKQALRKALEQGAGVQIASFTKVENFELARDTIFSRASGIVTDYKVLDQRETAGGVWTCKVRATVRADAVAQAWGEVVNVLRQVGEPKIMVLIHEEIDGKPQASSMVEMRIGEMFTKAGFHVVSRVGIDEIKRRDAEAALIKGDNEALMKLAKDAGAQIFIRGSARADWAGLREIYGNQVAMYNCTVMAQAYYTDTAQLLASESVPATERGVRSARRDSPQAAATALAEATFSDSETRREGKLAVKLFDAVMEKWSQQITAGGDVMLEVERISYRTYVKLRKALEDVKNVASVAGEFDERSAKFRVKTTMSAESLAELLLEAPFTQMLEIDSQKLNQIRAHAVE